MCTRQVKHSIINHFNVIVLCLGVCFTFIRADWGFPQTDAQGKPAGSTEETSPPPGGQPDDQTLIEIRLGTLPDYSRIMLTFSNQLKTYAIRRVDVDSIMIDFGTAKSRNQGRLDLEDAMVAGISVAEESGRLVARVKVKPSRFNFRHFYTPDRRSVVMDLRPATPSAGADILGPGADRPGLKLELPSISETAATIRAVLPLIPQANSDTALLAQALDFMIAGNLPEAIKALELFNTKFPDSPRLDPALFLLGDCFFHLDPEKFSDYFLKATEAYENALSLFPNSPQAPRARLMVALAYLKMDFLTEAVNFFKLVIVKSPNDPAAAMAHTYLGEIYVKLEKRDLAKASFDSVLPWNPKGRFFLEQYYLLGRSYFSDGLFSEANEVFKDIINRDPGFYMDHPQILYYTGEGYYHLGRLNLARAFLYHSLNMEPDQENVDLLLARIGDTYKETGQEAQAIKIYSLTRQLYPDTVGALISQIRLADYGALRSLFDQDAIFTELENGVLAATLKIYKDIIESDKKSPLLELALYKVGTVYYKLGEYPQVIETVKRFLAEYPRSTLVREVRKLADQSILQHIKDLYNFKLYADAITFYRENKNLIDPDTWPEVRHYLGLAYAGLEMHEETIKLLEANKDLTDQEAERLIGLGRSYLKLGRLDEAAQAFEQFRERFPKSNEIAQTFLDQALAEFDQGLDDPALNHLEKAVAADPNLGRDAMIQDMLGQLFLRKGQYERGITAINKSIDYMKEMPDQQEALFMAYSRLGQAYAHLGREAEAVEAIDAALAAAPANPMPETLYLLAHAFKKLKLISRQEQILNMLAQSTKPFWREVANEEMKALKPNEQITRLLKSAPPDKP